MARQALRPYTRSAGSVWERWGLGGLNVARKCRIVARAVVAPVELPQHLRSPRVRCVAVASELSKLTVTGRPEGPGARQVVLVCFGRRRVAVGSVVQVVHQQAAVG